MTAATILGVQQTTRTGDRPLTKKEVLGFVSRLAGEISLEGVLDNFIRLPQERHKVRMGEILESLRTKKLIRSRIHPQTKVRVYRALKEGKSE